MTEESARTYEGIFGPDKTRTRRVIVGVKIVDVVESKYIGTQELTWADTYRVLDYDKATDFDIIEFYEDALEAGKPV